MNDSPQVKWDLLAWRPLRAAVMSAAFPVVLQAAALAAVVALAVNGLGIGAGLKAEELMTLRKTNLTTLVVWGLWWPGMIAIAVLFGRAWCTVCPMELANRIGDAAARKLGWPRARLGKYLRAGWSVVVLYLTLQLLVAGVSIHRVPHYTAILLFVLLGGALLAGMVFSEPRSFCRAFCPAAALLSVYGRNTPVQLEAKEPSVCERCPTKDCVRAENRNRFDQRSCPSLLRPFNREPSDGCVLCLQCAKVCPYGNMGVGLVAPGAPVRRKALLKPFEAAFVMVALGFVAHDTIGEVGWFDGLFHTVPAKLSVWWSAIGFDWLEALWFLLVFPLAVWLVIAGIGYLLGHCGNLATLLLAAATGAAPVIAVAHLAKAAAKMASWGGFLPLALRGPRGIDALHRIADHSLSAPAAFIGLSVLGWVTLALVLGMAWKTWRWARQIPADAAVAARTALAGAAILFGAVLVVWGWPGL
ncbi:MAG: 4Fe-4S binding protein [Chloroflexi bacterium]|nr:4Fe-4S binding protein [Chloroflexota bacterium]